MLFLSSLISAFAVALVVGGERGGLATPLSLRNA
jgi:hypothetical protein